MRYDPNRRRRYLHGLACMPQEHILEGMYASEIAQALGIGVPTAKRVKTGIKTLSYENAKEDAKCYDFDDGEDRKLREWLENLA